MIGSLGQQIEFWLKAQLQDKFSLLNWENQPEVAKTLKDNGYDIKLKGYGEYVLSHFNTPISSLKVQINFSADKKVDTDDE